MKKPKHSNELEEPSTDSSKEIDAVLEDLDDLDDEIIDLEDVVEPYSKGHEDDDEFVSDAEILGAEKGLGLRGFEDKTESDDEFLLEDDLLKELPFFQNEKAEPEPAQKANSVSEELEELAPELFGDSGEETLRGPEGQTEALLSEEPEQQLFVPPVAASDIEEPELSAPPIEEPVPEEAQPEAFVLPVAAPFVEEPEPEVSVQPVPASAEAGVSLDDFVAQIENKLVDAIREIVEARLPEIVRTVLREEIAKLRSDQDPED